MNRRCFFLLLITLFVLWALTACGTALTTDEALSDASLSQEDDMSDHPMLQYAGTYAESRAGRGTIEVTLAQNDGADIVVRWSNGAAETIYWNMSGTFHQRTKTIQYKDAMKTVQTYDANGNSTSEIVYRNGKGSLTFTDDGLIWTDKEEHVADDAVFVKV